MGPYSTARPQYLFLPEYPPGIDHAEGVGVLTYIIYTCILCASTVSLLACTEYFPYLSDNYCSS